MPELRSDGSIIPTCYFCERKIADYAPVVRAHDMSAAHVGCVRSLILKDKYDFEALLEFMGAGEGEFEEL